MIGAIQRLSINGEECNGAFGSKAKMTQRPHVRNANSNKPRTRLLKSLQMMAKVIWSLVKLSLAMAVTGYFISSHVPTQKFILRYSQDFIYPVMRQIRLWSIPIIQLHPFLSEFHEEECLLENPLYGDPTLDCWPCEDTKTIINLTGAFNFSTVYVVNEKPFVTNDVLKSQVTIDILRQMYKENSEVLEMGTTRAAFNGQTVLRLKDVMDLDLNNTTRDFHVMWKMHRATAARVIRKVFLRPQFVPKTSEVSLQKFIYIDGPEAEQYHLPLTDFANVWMAQGQGFRTIVLDPSEACRGNCSSLSIKLNSMDVLYFNWQFYRARSLPSRTSNEPSVTFLGSFY